MKACMGGLYLPQTWGEKISTKMMRPHFFFFFCHTFTFNLFFFLYTYTVLGNVNAFLRNVNVFITWDFSGKMYVSYYNFFICVFNFFG